MRLALVIAIWKRHDLERIVLDNFRSQSKKFGFEIIVAGSEGETSKELATGLHYIEVLNYPVSNKHNALLRKAKELNVDGVILMGSDDIVNDGFWEHIYSLSSDESCVIGFKDVYFFNTINNGLAHFKGYENKNQSVGAGRFFSRNVLNQMGWRLWSNGKNSGLDSDCSFRLKSKKIEEKLFTLDERDSFIVDIKHERNITNRSILKICNHVNSNIMAKKVGVKVIEKVGKLENKESNEAIDKRKFYDIIGTGKGALKANVIYSNVSGSNVELFLRKGLAKLA